MIKIRIRNDDHEIDLQFPISENKLYAKLAEIHAIEGKDAPQSAFVTEVYWPEELSMLKDRFANLDELNYLARRMESFDYHEYDQFLIGITKLENPTEKDLINLTFNLDHFTLCKDVSSYGKIGREYQSPITIGTVFFRLWRGWYLVKSEVINIKTPVSRVGNKTAILHILYALFPLHYGRFIDVFGGSGSVLLGKPTIDAFEVYNDFDRNLVNLFRCMKERTMATIRELGFCNLNSREDFIAIRKFFDHETFDDRFLTEELMLTEIMLPPLEAAELKEIRMRISEDYDVRRASMFLKLLRNSYSSSGKSFASQPFDIRKLFGLIQELEDRMANVVIENQDFETLIRHYDRPDAFFYADPPYFSTEDMYEVGFGWDDHVRLRETLGRIKGKFLLSYNDCPEIRELYDGFSLFDFSRTHSMAQRYEAGKEFKELLIANYDYYERENAKPKQLTLFDIYGDENYDYEKILKESIISCKIR